VVADDRRDLDLMHREDHRGRAAAAAEREAGGGDRAEGDAVAVVLGRYEGREGALLAQRGDGLDGEAGAAVDVVGVGTGDLGDLTDPGQEGGVAIGGDGHAACASSWASADEIEATDSKTLRLSISSGNSRSKVSSSASITLTLACDVMPAS
jgi:hypothetical protein